MKMNCSHDYHGITLRNDGYGWTIQIKLLGKYQQLRTYAGNAEDAARRHDIALSKLEGFAEPGAMPNFPEDFDSIDLSRPTIEKLENGAAFFDALQSLFSGLCKDAEAVGLDPVEMANARRENVKKKLESLIHKKAIARLKFSERLLKLRGAAALLGLPIEQSQQLSDMLAKTQEILERK